MFSFAETFWSCKPSKLKCYVSTDGWIITIGTPLVSVLKLEHKMFRLFSLKYHITPHIYLLTMRLSCNGSKIAE